jgi:hypothetical protein
MTLARLSAIPLNATLPEQANRSAIVAAGGTAELSATTMEIISYLSEPEV